MCRQVAIYDLAYDEAAEGWPIAAAELQHSKVPNESLKGSSHSTYHHKSHLDPLELFPHIIPHSYSSYG